MISVIVPVYNVEKYLDRCVKSILAQTYSDFELILVDDGSPDNCPKMCDEYAMKDSRVKAIHKKNGGLSEARNFGTINSEGKWITYIDSDDYVSVDYLENLWRLREKYNADIAVTGICECIEGKKLKPNKNENEYCYSGIEALENMLYQNTLDSSACAMLISSSIARDNLFPVGKYHEDEFTTYKFYIHADSVAVSTKSQYFYLQREGSIMHTFGQSSIDELEAADNYVKFCGDYYPELVPAATSKKFSDYCQVLLSNKNLESYDNVVYKNIICFLQTNKNNILKDKKCRTKNRIAALILYFGIKIFRLIGSRN